jgi:5-methylcytosine-specific restriction endonuclease McrA
LPPVEKYALHIDLLRCEFCGQHNKLLDFCSACGRARKSFIIAQPTDYQGDPKLDFSCRSCRSQRVLSPFCIYCDRGMQMHGTGKSFKPRRPRNLKGQSAQRPVPGRFANTIFGTLECFVCGTTKYPTIHHIVPTSKGGQRNAKDNRVSACRPCHDKIHAKPPSKRKRRADVVGLHTGVAKPIQLRTP